MCFTCVHITSPRDLVILLWSVQWTILVCGKDTHTVPLQHCATGPSLSGALGWGGVELHNSWSLITHGKPLLRRAYAFKVCFKEFVYGNSPLLNNEGELDHNANIITKFSHLMLHWQMGWCHFLLSLEVQYYLWSQCDGVVPVQHLLMNLQQNQESRY